MGSDFKSLENPDFNAEWIPIPHLNSKHFEFFKVRHYGALHFVKRPTKAYRNNLVTTESLKKEFFIGYNLNHPSIVRYMRLENGTVFEEYIDGLTLREMIDCDDERLQSPDFIERICRQLLDATLYLHSRGVVHNDIKPENVMVSRIDDQLKLVDLGCATTDMWDATEGFTPAYKAPEQGINSTNVYTDIFLIGKIIEELAAKAGITGRWNKFIKKATAEAISDRFSSDSEAISAIPKKRTAKPLLLAATVFSVMVLALIYFVSVDRKMAESDISNVADATGLNVAKDTVVIYSPQEPADGSVIPEKQPSTRELIDTQLKKYIIDMYNKDIFPDCKKYAQLTSDKDRMELEQRVNQTMESVIAKIMDYAETLAAKYPEEADYARLQASVLLNAQQTVSGMLMYPDYGKNKSMEEEKLIVSEADSI